eukprot:bmy_16541T0
MGQRCTSPRLHIHCVFNANDFLPLQASLFPPPSSHCDPVQPPAAPAADRQGKRERCPCAFSTHPHFPDIQPTEVHEPLSLQTRLSAPTTGRGTTPLWGCFKSLTPWRSGSCRRQTPFWSWCCTSANPFQYPQWPIQSGVLSVTAQDLNDGLGRVALPFHSHYQCFTVATFALLDIGSWSAHRGPLRSMCSSCLLPIC